MGPNFSDAPAYRAWLQSDEYRADIRKLLGEQPNPARTDYRIVDPESIDAMTDRATWHSREAERLLKMARELQEAMGVTQ